MATKIITLIKEVIDNDIDHRTYKRMEASLKGLPDVSQDAASSDTEEDHDFSIISRYRDFRDAKLRRKLSRWMSSDTGIDEYDNLPSADEAYIYTFSVPDDFSDEQAKALEVLMHEYIVRGAVFDWYKFAGIQPVDSEASLNEVEEDIVYYLGGTSSFGDDAHSFAHVQDNIYRLSVSINAIAKEVDAVTQKYARTLDSRKGIRPDSISSDSNNERDKLLITRFIDKWVAELKTKLRFCVCPSADVPSETLPDGFFHVYFKFRDDFEPGILPDMMALIHGYLTNGTVYEWYRSINLQNSAPYLAETDDILTRIVSAFRQAIPAKAPHLITLLQTNSDGTTIYRVSLLIEDLLRQIEAVTRKRSDVSERRGLPTMPDAIASDFIGAIDSGLVTRYISKWASELRNRLRLWICPAGEVPYGAELTGYENFIFKFKDGFDSNILSVVKELINTQLTSGPLSDWYNSIGVKDSDVFYSEALNAQDSTLRNLRGKPVATRPLQPFGPPFPTTPLF